MGDNKENKISGTEDDEQRPIIELDDLLNDSDEQTLANELDDLLNDSDEQTLANEPDELESEHEEETTQTEESEAESKEGKPENESQKGLEKKPKGKKWLWVLVVIVLLSLSAAGGYYLVKEKKVLNLNEKIKQKLNAANSFKRKKPSQAVIQKEETIEFTSFVIPFKQNIKFTYISLSVIFKLPDKKAKRKMVLEKNWIRAMIYDVIKDKMDISEETLSSKHLKTIIFRSVQDTLPACRINDIEIIDFQVV